MPWCCCEEENPKNEHVLTVRSTTDHIALDGGGHESGSPQARSCFEPPGPSHPDPRDFTVVFEKCDSLKEVGLYLSLVDGIGLLIHDIKAGLAQDWNTQHPELQVKKDDCILQVNGVTDNLSELILMLKREPVLEMRLRHATTFHVFVQHEESQSKHLGLNVSHLPNDRTLRVDDVTVGLVSDWNASHESACVRKGDRVIKVNNVCNSASKMLKLIRTEGALDMLFFRLDE